MVPLTSFRTVRLAVLTGQKLWENNGFVPHPKLGPSITNIFIFLTSFVNRPTAARRYRGRGRALELNWTLGILGMRILHVLKCRFNYIDAILMRSFFKNKPPNFSFLFPNRILLTLLLHPEPVP